MKKIKVTYTIVAYITPYGFDNNESELQRAVEIVGEEPFAYYNEETSSIDAEFVEAGE